MTTSELKTKLTTELESFRTDYLSKTRIWAEEQVERNIQRKRQYLELGSELIKTIGRDGYHKEQKFVYNSPDWMFHRTLFIEKSVKNAELHFESSLDKLISRIESKGLNMNNISIRHCKVYVNIEIVITDGVKTVRAFTIIAEGEIQRPHYRYLVK